MRSGKRGNRCFYPFEYCATVSLAELASANVVGFADKATENFTFIGPAFTQIGGGENFTYGDIKVNCDETGEGDGSGWQPLGDFICVLDENGSFVRKLVYAPQYIADAYECSTGWYDDADVANEDYSTCWNSEPLAFGYGVQVSAAAGMNSKATFSGEVKKTATVTDVENFMSVANCSPVDVKLGEVVVNCDETGEGDGSGWQPLGDFICVLDENGSFVRKLVYAPQYIADAYECTKGWYDDVDVANEDYSTCWNNKVSYAPGEGFQVSAAAGMGATVTIKTALPVAAE